VDLDRVVAAGNVGKVKYATVITVCYQLAVTDKLMLENNVVNQDCHHVHKDKPVADVSV